MPQNLEPFNHPNIDDAEVARQLAINLYEKALGTVYSHATFGAIFLFLFFTKIDLLWLIIWGAVLYGNAAVRFIFIRKWLASSNEERQKAWMSTMSLATSLINGLLWSTTVFFLDFANMPFESVAVSVMVFGLAAGAAAYSAYFIPAFYLAVVPYLASYIIYHLIQFTFESFLMVMILAVFGAMLYGQAIQLNTTHRRNIVQRIENDRLITVLKHVNKGIEHEAHTDFLTGVHNRRYFEKLIKKLWRRHLVDEKPVSFIMADIDSFKQFNDTHGHKLGDEVLIQVANLLGDSIRYSDRLFRFGSEEFMLILPETNLDQAQTIAENLRQRIEQHLFESEDLSLKITISVGVSSRVPFNMYDYKELIGEVDQALHEAKRLGRNRVAQYHPTEEQTVED